MTLHISATTGCNLGCDYCYENPDRERKQEWVDRQYDMDEIMQQLEQWKERYPNENPGMHGGEPLLVRKEDLEEIFSYIYENWDGPSHIQTNGTLMDEDHVEMFEKYNVGVGISCDGPPELNRKRKAAGERGSDQRSATDKMTEATNEAIDMCLEADVGIGIITVLHEVNAGTEGDFEKLLDWMDDICERGGSGHFNPAIPYEEVPDGEDLALSGETLRDRYLRAWEWHKAETYRSWGPMSDYVDNLLGNQLNNCTVNKCDVGNAGAAKIIMGNGETTGCGKTWGQYGDGGTFLQGESTGNEYNNDEERYEVLKQTPGWVTEDAPDMGGCKGCKYWKVCQGGCPGAGQDDDYRNRTHFCKAKYGLYEAVEDDLRVLMPNIRLVTDLPWDAETSDLASTWQLDIKPFAAMDPSEPGKSSVIGGFDHSQGTVLDNVPQEILDDMSFEQKVRMYESRYGEENVTSDKNTGMIHADSAMPRTGDGSGWERSDQA